MSSIGGKRRKVRSEILIEKYGLTCFWCQCVLKNLPITLDRDCSDHITIEHLQPVSLGGGHDIANLRLACFRCNNARGGSPDPYCPAVS